MPFSIKRLTVAKLELELANASEMNLNIQEILVIMLKQTHKQAVVCLHQELHFKYYYYDATFYSLNDQKWAKRLLCPCLCELTSSTTDGVWGCSGAREIRFLQVAAASVVTKQAVFGSCFAQSEFEKGLQVSWSVNRKEDSQTRKRVSKHDWICITTTTTTQQKASDS